MIEEYSNVINEINKSKVQIYYRLNQLGSMTGLKDRALKYRMKKVKEDYKHIPNLLRFVGRAWEIHYTLIDQFRPKYKRKETTVSNHKWETLLTWNLLDDYDVKYHIQLIEEVKELLPTVNIAYCIEKDRRGFNHIHALIDDDKEKVEVSVAKVLSKYLNKNYYRTQVENIYNYYSVTSYIQKSGEITII
ncbi:hypothetical protein EKM05_05995 [Flavobacterium sp. GSP27]|uniref:hypothetical protein n=1 Tax=Flavobacterium sp. GSP27 TaxID=2497489 RepID=UPI000F84B8EF|nr:hypothetical protein [Flavobacterium sp. GSP27]RTZ09854.1 hypothetical protein EKM05_05995 [Flavobacterium sp. GSP27]